MNSDEALGTFSWGVLLFVSCIYTLAPFLSAARWGRIQEINRMVTKLSSSPKSAIQIDLFFLAFLLMLFSWTMYSYAALPDWLRSRHGLKISALDLVGLVTMIFLQFVEQRIIFGSTNQEKNN
jgi:hypothetical protein